MYYTKTVGVDVKREEGERFNPFNLTLQVLGQDPNQDANRDITEERLKVMISMYIIFISITKKK